MKRCYQCASLVEAQLAVDLLRVAGIDARIFNSNAQSGLGEIPFTQTWPEIWLLDDADYARARALLESIERSAGTGSVRCPACGEDNPRSFELCWHCGADLDVPQ